MEKLERLCCFDAYQDFAIRFIVVFKLLKCVVFDT